MDNPETLGDIAVFTAVVREGSFTRAADKLELSNSQVSKCVNRLERTLGARLLNRTTRRLRLTEAGSALYENSASALAAIEDAKLAVSQLQGTPRGTLKVSGSIAFGATQLPPHHQSPHGAISGAGHRAGAGGQARRPRARGH